MIPKILHFIWIGVNPVPKSFLEVYFPQWKAAHTDYEIKMWSEETLDSQEQFINKGIILDKSLNPGLRADALRLEVLLRYGGVYIDIDMACIKPLDPLLSKSIDFIIGVSHTKVFEVNNALLASTKDHPLIKHLIETLA
jgi:mannosyltransferase OCH1-like enzyme